VFAHGLAVGPRQLRPQRANAIIQLLDLRLSQYRSGRLCLETINKSGKEVDVFRLHWRELVITLGQRELCR